MSNDKDVKIEAKPATETKAKGEETVKTEEDRKVRQSIPIEKVIVHPLVLLSVVDHFNRMGKVGNYKRVVGILLGAMKGKGILDISNSFAGTFRSSD